MFLSVYLHITIVVLEVTDCPINQSFGFQSFQTTEQAEVKVYYHFVDSFTSAFPISVSTHDLSKCTSSYVYASM